jgi:hypothetical protein
LRFGHQAVPGVQQEPREQPSPPEGRTEAAGPFGTLTAFHAEMRFLGFASGRRGAIQQSIDVEFMESQ